MDAVVEGSYQRQKNSLLKDQETCTYCGTKGHGRNSPTRIRRKECPAFGTKCNHCTKDHHFERMCRSKHKAKPAKDTEHEDTISDVLCQVESLKSAKGTSLDHHVFDKFTKGWLRRRSKCQPYIRLRMNIHYEDYNHFCFPLQVPLAQSSFVSAMADTGCQSCSAGLKVIKKLGVSIEDLIPVTIKMQTANNDTFMSWRHHTEVIGEEQERRGVLYDRLCNRQHRQIIP